MYLCAGGGQLEGLDQGLGLGVLFLKIKQFVSKCPAACLAGEGIGEDTG